MDNAIIDRIGEIGRTAFTVYAVLARHADANGVCYPGVERIAELVGISDRQVGRELTKLGNAGLVTKRRRSLGRGTGTHNVYSLVNHLSSLHPDTGVRMKGELHQDTGVPLKVTSGHSGSLHPDMGVRQTRTKNKKSKKLRFSDDDRELSQWFFEQLQGINPGHKAPTSFDRWANDIRLMRERDNRTPEQIRDLFGWANAHHFWQSNILSPGKLREKWDTLTLQKTRDKNGHNRSSRQDSPARIR